MFIRRSGPCPFSEATRAAKLPKKEATARSAVPHALRFRKHPEEHDVSTVHARPFAGRNQSACGRAQPV